MSRPTLTRPYFEALYAERDDPWGFATSAYEAAKYDATLAALGDRRFARALEYGCSIGVFTRRLAERCDRLLALDVSTRAVERARARLRGLGNVVVERRTLPDELPDERFDLVVCSEVLYYLERDALVAAIPRLADLLVEGGILLAVHWTRPTRTYPLSGDEVHELLIEQLGADHVLFWREDCYRLDRFRRAAATTPSHHWAAP